MALHIKTDEEFDRALEFLAKAEQRTKSDVVRESVLSRYRARRRGFEFGALRALQKKARKSSDIQRELKQYDSDDDLD
jgi:hypothetical protein